MKKHKIAIFIGGYLPAKKYGGPVTSISNLVDNLGEIFEFYIISNDHEFNDYTRLPSIVDGWNKVGKAKVLYIKEKEYLKNNFRSILKEINAECVYLSSVFYYKMNFPAIRAAKSLGIPVILAPRGEICDGALSIKKDKKKLFLAYENVIGIFKDVFFHVTSEEEFMAVKRIFCTDDSKIFSLPNMPCAIHFVEDKQKQENTLSIIYLSRIVEKKNLLFAIRQINKCKANIVFDIYGPIEDENYWEQCKHEIEQAPQNVSISYKGALSPGESINAFQNHDVFLFPTLSENYGHVIVEAITSGCSVILSKGTTPWDDIDNGGGYVIPLENNELWSQAVDSLAYMSPDLYRKLNIKLRKYVLDKFSISMVKEAYSKMFYDVMN